VATAQQWIDELRSDLEDWPETVTDNYTTTDTTTTKIQLSNFPVNKVTSLKVNSVVKVETTDWTMDYDRGVLTLVVAPGNAQLVEVFYERVRFRDSKMIAALADGVRGLYPKVYVKGEIFIRCRSTITIYDLTNSTDCPDTISDISWVNATDQGKARAALAKPETQVHWGEFKIYGALEVSWTEWQFFHRHDKLVHMTKEPTASDVVKLVYSTSPTPPTAVGTTIDVPDPYYHLPKWFALGTLVGKKEIQRDMSDTYTVMQNQNAVPPRMQTVLKQDYFADYYRELKERPMQPMRRSIRKGLPREI